MKALSIQEIAQALGTCSKQKGAVHSICSDTRQIEPDCLFIALRGERFDGHDYAQKAVELGAAVVLCERDCGLGERQIRVADTYRALADLAHYYCGLFAIPAVAVTGSVGKTTTKEMVACVLGSSFRVLKSEKNYNNEIGLPMTLFGLDDSIQIAVLEMGMSGFGEIALLSRTAQPELAIISNIGLSHIEALGSQENILKAKLEILEGMPDDAPLILNGDDTFLQNLAFPPRPVYHYGIENSNCQFRACEIHMENGHTSFTMEYDSIRQAVQLPCAGRHNVYNALAALAAGAYFGIPLPQAAKALEQYVPSGMRQRIRTVKGITFIEDCYNASPESLSAALPVLMETDAKRHIAVLGDMCELGAYTQEAHQKVGELTAALGVDILMTYGTSSAETAWSAKLAGAVKAMHFTGKKELSEYLLHLLQTGDAVLCKASRAMQLEDVLHAVYKGLETE